MKSPRRGTYEVEFRAQNRAWAPLLRLLRSNLRPRVGLRWATLGYVGLRWATLAVVGLGWGSLRAAPGAVAPGSPSAFVSSSWALRSSPGAVAPGSPVFAPCRSGSASGAERSYRCLRHPSLRLSSPSASGGDRSYRCLHHPTLRSFLLFASGGDSS